MAKALTVDDVILGEAVSGTASERYRDMLGIASVIENRARMLGVTPQDVVSAVRNGKKQFDAYSKALPSGVENYRELAREALREVATAGPVHNATFYATPAAKDNLPKGLREEVRTKGHVYFSDPQQRAINTAVGYRKPAPVPVQSRVPAPTFADRLPTPPTTATAYAPSQQVPGAVQAVNAMALPSIGRAPVGNVTTSSLPPVGRTQMAATPTMDLPPSVMARMAPEPMAPVPTRAPQRPAPTQMAMPSRPVSRPPEWGAPTSQMANLPASVMERIAGFPTVQTSPASVPTPTSASLPASVMERMTGFPQGLPTRQANVPTPTRAPARPTAQIANVPTPTPRDSLPVMERMAGFPRGTPVPTRAPQRQQVASVPAPRTAPRGVMDSIMGAVVSPAAAATMEQRPGLPASVMERMNAPAMPSVDVTGYRTAMAPANVPTPTAALRPSTSIPTPTPAPARPSENVSAPRTAPRDSWGGMRTASARPAHDPVAINDRAVEAVSAPRQATRQTTAMPTAATAFVGAPSVMDKITGGIGNKVRSFPGKIGGAPGIAGGLLGALVGGAPGAILGNMIGRQFSPEYAARVAMENAARGYGSYYGFGLGQGGRYGYGTGIGGISFRPDGTTGLGAPGIPGAPSGSGNGASDRGVSNSAKGRSPGGGGLF